MKKTKILTLILMLILGAGLGFTCENCTKNDKRIHKIAAQTQAPIVYIKPLTIVKNPLGYYNKQVKLIGKFDKFTTLGLDYPAAMRSSEEYISFLLQRDDVLDHNVPLSEMKLFLKRDYAEKFIELDTGDIVLIEGKMFSNALGDVWIDVTKLDIKEKVKKAESK